MRSSEGRIFRWGKPHPTEGGGDGRLLTDTVWVVAGASVGEVERPAWARELPILRGAVVEGDYGADVNLDGVVDVYDLVRFAEEWLGG